jgi:hypothetical protein
LRGALLAAEQQQELMRIKLEEERSEREKAQKQVRVRAQAVHGWCQVTRVEVNKRPANGL